MWALHQQPYVVTSYSSFSPFHCTYAYFHWLKTKIQWTYERGNERTNGRIDTAYCELFVSYFADTAVFISLQKTTIILTPIMSLATVFIQSKRTGLWLGWTNEWGDERTKKQQLAIQYLPHWTNVSISCQWVAIF